MKKKLLLITILLIPFLSVSAATAHCPERYKGEGKLICSIKNEDKENYTNCIEKAVGVVACDDGYYDYYDKVNPGQSEQVKEVEEKSETTTASDNSGVCDPSVGLGPSLVFIGHIVRLAKILIPLIIVVLGIVDFFKAITAGKDEELKKSAKTFMWRLVAGVLIFFLPSIISFVFSWVENWSNYEGNYEQCLKCVWDVGKCTK